MAREGLARQPKFSTMHPNVYRAAFSAALLVPGTLALIAGIAVLLAFGADDAARIDLLIFGMVIIYATLFVVAYVWRERDDDESRDEPGPGQRVVE